jgi:hypothetical protein
MGIRFRSKSEAMFARYLELHVDENKRNCAPDASLYGVIGEGSGGFAYEPKGFSIDGWCFDFLVWKSEWDEDLCIPRLRMHFIEYKPSKPTDTYVQEFENRCLKVFPKWEDFMDNWSASIYYGSVFNTNRGRGDCFPVADGKWRLNWRNIDWLMNFEDQVKSTRFDLIANS